MKKIKRICCSLLLLGLMLPQIPQMTANAASGVWKHDSKGWWYSFSGGSFAKNEWIKDGGNWYYFDSKGYMVNGWKKIGGKWYYFKGGVMQTGWKKISNKWYFFKNGEMQTGWKKISGKWYFFKNGAMLTGVNTIGGVNYTFNKNGECQNLSADEVFEKDTTYFGVFGDPYSELFLNVRRNGSFSIGTYDDFMGETDTKGKLTNIVKTRSAYKMEMTSVSDENGLKNGTVLYLYGKGTSISAIPKEFLQNGKNTSNTFGNDWQDMTELPKEAVYLALDAGGYWFLLKEM